ncbi:MAG TPA: hypothetical protein VF989_14530, partial [Polyangiaceae bacterium]
MQKLNVLSSALLGGAAAVLGTTAPGCAAETTGNGQTSAAGVGGAGAVSTSAQGAGGSTAAANSAAVGVGGAAATGVGGSVTGVGGAATGAGGTGGTTMSERPCEVVTMAAGSDPVIGNFDAITSVDPLAGVLALQNMDGLNAGTYGFDESEGGGTGTRMWSIATPGANGTAQAVRMTVSGATVWGGGFGMWINPCYDAVAYGGIEFYAMGTNVGGLHLEFANPETSNSADGGDCTAANCSAAYTDVTVGSTFTLVQVPWSSLTAGTNQNGSHIFNPAKL